MYLDAEKNFGEENIYNFQLILKFGCSGQFSINILQKLNAFQFVHNISLKGECFQSHNKKPKEKGRRPDAS